MKRMETWRWLPTALLLAVGGTTGTWAEDFAIQSFDGTGRLGWNEIALATNYRVEWACAPAGPWTDFAGAAASLDSVPPTGTGSVWRSVPMCYRVVATVTNAWPEIDLAGDLAFGDVAVVITATRTLSILNRGVLDLHVTGIDYPEGFSGPWSGTVRAGGTRNVTVTFAPTAEMAYGGLVTVSSDTQGGTSTRAISGTGVPATYLVVDLLGGASAPSYPVTYLDAVPPGGWTDEYKTTKLVLRRIPATTGFTMGSPGDELGRCSDETQHQVTLTADFYLGVFEVTQKQWERVMGNWPAYFNNADYRDSRPVESVSYYEIRENPLPVISYFEKGSAISPNWPASSQVHADSFMGKLRTKTGLAAFDLPTESQWEYACRAGTTTALNSGKNLTATESCPNMSEVGRYRYNGGSGSSQGGDTSVATAKVGSYLPNPWGLYDMHGNVREWCLDWYGTYPGNVIDPPGASSESDRVYRGGSWTYGATYCRSAYRYAFHPKERYDLIGFRACYIP